MRPLDDCWTIAGRFAASTGEAPFGGKHGAGVHTQLAKVESVEDTPGGAAFTVKIQSQKFKSST